MSDNFDLAIYIKGDRKPTAVYDAYLVIDYVVGETTTVPSVLGEFEETADTLITAADLVMAVTGTACSDAYPFVGTVAVQDPVAQTEVAVGSTVDVTLSEGPCAGETIPVPAVGECPTVAAATAIIEGDGLTVNPVNIEEESVVCDAGLVLRTVPPGGTEVENGSEVTLVVATEPVILSDVTISKLTVPTYAFTVASYPVSVRLQNASGAGPSGPGTVTVTGSDGTVFAGGFANIDPGEQLGIAFTWNPDTRGRVIWDAEVTISGVVVDTATKSSRVVY